MFHKSHFIIMVSLLGIVLASLVGCQSEDQDRMPTMPAEGDSVNLGGYAQMEDGSVVVDGRQLNWVLSDYATLPYAFWMYVEVNEQDVVGAQPGEHQVPVILEEVILQFSELPGEVTQIVIAVKAVHDEHDFTFTERGRFTVVDGSVNIPLDDEDLVAYFGVTHYSIWFQVLGGRNGQGTACGKVALSGVMPSGQDVTFSKRICVGTTAAPTFTCEGTLFDGFCWYLSGDSATCEATCQAEGLVVDTTIDASGNFWDAHDAAYCRDLLVLLQHPYIALSTTNFSMTSGYGLCGASNTGIVIKRDGGPQDATHVFNNGQVACPCR